VFSSFIDEIRARSATALIPTGVSIFLECLPLAVLLLTVRKKPLDRRIQASFDWLHRIRNAHRVPFRATAIRIRIEPLNKKATVTLDLRPSSTLAEARQSLEDTIQPVVPGHELLGFYRSDGGEIDPHAPLAEQIHGEELVMQYVAFQPRRDEEE
jgi:hypothetical protein